MTRNKAGPLGRTPAHRTVQNHIPASDPVQELLSRLSGVKKTGNRRWRAHCPAHDDKHPSLDIREADDGRLLLQCRSQNCSAESICKAVGRELHDLFPSNNDDRSARRRKPVAKSKPARTYATPDDAAVALSNTPDLRGGTVTRHAYSDAFVILRFDFADDRDKSFRPVHKTDDGWVIGDPRGKLPLYQLSKLDGADRIYVCEGEACIAMARIIGLCATTSAHGSKSGERTDWSPLAGRDIYILPDNDPSGKEYARAVTNILTKLNPPATVRIVELPDLPGAGDIVDFINARDSRESDDLRRMIEAIAEETPTWQPVEAADAPVTLRWQPFPVHVLPEPIQSFVTQGSRAIGCDPAMIALPTLAAVASVIGTTRRIRLKRTWCAPAVLWTTIVGHSGTLKSPAQEYALRPLMRLQADAFRAHAEAMTSYELQQLRHERDLALWKKEKRDNDPPTKPEEPNAVRLVCADATVEALAPILETNLRGVLLARDELAGWLGSFDRYRAGKGGDSATWLELHRAGPLIIDRKTGKRIVYVPRAAVSLAGTIQPETLRRALGCEHFQDGLAARLLLAMPPRRRKQWSDADVAQRTVDAFASMLASLRTLQHNIGDNCEPVPVDVPLSDDGRRAWVAFYNEHAGRQDDTHDSDLAAAFSKLEGYAARFALVFHFVRWAAVPDFNADAIGPESVEAGAELAQWFCHETERLYGVFAETDEDRARRELVEYIRSRGGSVTARDLRRGPRQYRSADAASEALEELVQAGLAAWDHQATGKAGQPAKRLRLIAEINGDTGDGDSITPGAIKNANTVAVATVATQTSDETPPGWSPETWRTVCDAEAVGEPVSTQTESDRKTA